MSYKQSLNRATWTLIAVAMLAAVMMLVAPGCTPQQMGSTFGTPATPDTQRPDGTMQLGQPATTGWLPPVLEGLSLALTMFGLPTIALWVNNVKKAGQDAAAAMLQQTKEAHSTNADAIATLQANVTSCQAALNVIAGKN